MIIINPTESNENGVVMNQTCRFGYEGHMQICRSSIMRSKWGGMGGKAKSSLSLTGGEGGVWRGAKSAHVILEQPLKLSDCGFVKFS